MAIKPFINPSVGVAERPATISGAMNFISGGSPLGTSVVSAAANKIVGFQRGAAAVAPRAPDLGSIIKTLSTNILNNVENRVQSINQNVQQIIQKNFQNQLGEYTDKLQSVDADQPSKILQNFLGLYEKAIGYMQFFANPRNVKQLGNNLNDLRKVFADTFEVAKNIRKTIVRVVNQLSNLPTASAGGGGINLDVDLPGAPLKKGGAPLRRRMGGARGMLAAGGLGFGAGAVTSALAQPGGEVQPVVTETGGGISQTMLEKFSGILDRFDAAIKSMSKKAAEAPKQQSKTSPSTGQKEKPDSGPSAGTTSPGAATDQLKGNTNAQKVYNALLSEGFSPEAASGVIGNLMQESGVDPTKRQNDGGPGRGMAQWGTGKGSGERWDRLTSWAKKNGKDPMTLETQYEYMIMEMKERGTFRRLKDVKDVRAATKLFEDEMLAAGVPMMENRYKFAEMAYKQYGKSPVPTSTADKKLIPGTVPATKQEISQKTDIKAQISQVSPMVTAAPTQQQLQQQTAKQVSQPAIIQSQPQVNVVPLNMGQQGSRGVQKPPTTSAGRVSGESAIPFLPTGNPDNFLTLYSKMVYNIVDG